MENYGKIPFKSIDSMYCSFSESYIVRINKIFKIEVKKWLKIVLEQFLLSKTDEEIYREHYETINKNIKEIRKIREMIQEKLNTTINVHVNTLIAEGKDTNYIKKIISNTCGIEINLKNALKNEKLLVEYKNQHKGRYYVWNWDKFNTIWKSIHSKIGILIGIIVAVLIPYLALLSGLFTDTINIFKDLLSGQLVFALPILFLIGLCIRMIILPIHEAGHEYFYRLFGGKMGEFYIFKPGILNFSGYTTTDDSSFIDSRWKKFLIFFGGIFFEIQFTFVFYLILKLFQSLTGIFPTVIFYYLILRQSLSLFMNLNFFISKSDGYQIFINMINFPTLNETVSEYIQSWVANTNMNLPMNARQRKFVKGYLLSSIILLLFLLTIQFYVIQGLLLSFINNPIAIIPIDEITKIDNFLIQIIYIIGLVVFIIKLIDLSVVIIKQKKKLTQFIFLLQVRKRLTTEFHTENTEEMEYIGNYIILDNNPSIKLEDIPKFFRIVLVGRGVKNLSRLDDARTYYQNEVLIKQDIGSVNLLSHSLPLSQLSQLINDVSFTYIIGDFFGVIPLLKESLLHHENRIEFLNYAKDFTAIKRKDSKSTNNSLDQGLKDLLSSEFSEKFEGTYGIFGPVDNLSLKNIPENLQILLLGKGVENTHLNSERTFCCSHCAGHRSIECDKPKSYMELVGLMASYPYFIVHGAVYLLANLLIDAIAMLKTLVDDDEGIMELDK